MGIWRTNEGVPTKFHPPQLRPLLCESPRRRRRRRPRRQAMTGLQQTPNSIVPRRLSCPATHAASIDRPNDSLSRSTSKHQPLRTQPRSHRDTFHLTCKTTVPTDWIPTPDTETDTLLIRLSLRRHSTTYFGLKYIMYGRFQGPNSRQNPDRWAPTACQLQRLCTMRSTLHTFLSAAPCCQTFVLALTSQIHRTCFHYCFWPSLRYRPHGTPSP
ncbi:hypothetical protein CKAH01_14075 [Colletotrichum kahawae]|uniref:Uncharacterized protein n=1 Tax=Colletotrichum kahawae TaxID=34407 RepID=A0AAE0DAL8_COLKA|nr:hypothetical protein CKAH01_14075 [Colletotrichum kahawae]